MQFSMKDFFIQFSMQDFFKWSLKIIGFLYHLKSSIFFILFEI